MNSELEVELIHTHENKNSNIEPVIKKIAHISYRKEGDLTFATCANFIKKIILKNGHESLLKHAYYTEKISMSTLLNKWNYFDLPDHIRMFMSIDKTVDKLYVSGTLLMWKNFYEWNDDLLPSIVLHQMCPTVFPEYKLDSLPMQLLIPKKMKAYTFIIRGGSRLFTHQFVRHNHLAGFNQESTRYNDYTNEFNMIIPPSIKASVVDLERLKEEAFSDYNVMRRNGIRTEDARFFLPSGIEAKIGITLTHGALFGNLKHTRADRKAGRPSREINDAVTQMLEIVGDE